ncbi:MAG: alpha/beta fold hydrolase [Saprospiraceae bacterium]|nr:alpha/beta fold hydrolase [Saprospiraceae bacterium]
MLPESTLKKLRRVGQALNMLARVSPPLAGRAAFRLFCSPRRKALPEHDMAFLKAARQGTLEVKGVSISTYQWLPKGTDNGRTVLFLHGWESHSARWRHYVKALCKAGFTVQALDAPASGLSGGRMLNLLIFSAVVKKHIEENGVPYAMVGHSLGGGAAVMSTALFHAQRPQKMVLLGTFAESKRVIRDFGRIIGANETVLKHVDMEIERRSGIPVEAYSVVQQVTLLTDVQGLVLHDRDDDVAPVAEGRLIAERWSAAYLETEGFGHRMQHMSVVHAVRDFLVL